MRVLRLSAALSCAALAGFASQAQAATPHVRIVHLQPKALVRGTGFLPQEHLFVRLVGVGVSSKRVVANAAGAFRVSLVTPEPRSCGQYSLIVIRPAPAKPVRVKIGPPECAAP
jgi:hypothetical protein